MLSEFNENGARFMKPIGIFISFFPLVFVLWILIKIRKQNKGEIPLNIIFDKKTIYIILGLITAAIIYTSYMRGGRSIHNIFLQIIDKNYWKLTIPWLFLIGLWCWIFIKFREVTKNDYKRKNDD
jgi:hypothetical protein